MQLMIIIRLGHTEVPGGCYCTLIWSLNANARMHLATSCSDTMHLSVQTQSSLGATHRKL